LNSGDRLKALFIVWTVCGLIAIAMVFGLHDVDAFSGIALGVMLTTMTLLATFMITRVPNTVETRIDTGRIGSKAKHSDTALIDRLIESMSDTEVAALRRRLMGNDPVVGDDGELVTLDDLSAGKTNGSRSRAR
jgi:hypothetical protein